MSKLYFRYGTVGSAKTLNLLAVAHNYRQQNKNVIVMQPAIDTRFGIGVVKSRTGLQTKADLIIRENTDIDSELRLKEIAQDIHCIIVDECQFLPKLIIEQLFRIVVQYKIPVICYGLKTNFQSELFEGSKRLLELADSIEEVKTTCFFCNSKALFSLKLQDGRAVFTGKEVELGADEKYRPCCKSCYIEHKNQ